MGIDVHALNFLRFAAKEGPLGTVATIGRQCLFVPQEKVQKLLRLQAEPTVGRYCEDLLTDYLGASLVESFDNSDYEQATHIVDMNQPLPVRRQYDTVIDIGSLEHVYNAPQALKNISCLCAERGRILHVLPANNFCGHGFWQFSPELFFSLYSPGNGYKKTQVFLADLSNEFCWYRVEQPCRGQRAEATSCEKLYILVKAQKVGAFSHDGVQQSDYIDRWSNPAAAAAETSNPSIGRRIRRMVGQSPIEEYARFVYKKVKRLVPAETALSGKNPSLTRCRISELLDG